MVKVTLSCEPSGTLKRVYYLSEPAEGLSLDAIQEIIEFSRAKNTNKNVTGCLMYAGDFFFQYIEGPPATIDQLFSRIQDDPRHHNVKTIMSGYATSRQFKGWVAGIAEHNFFSDEMIQWREELSDIHEKRASSGLDVRLHELMSNFYAREQQHSI